MGTHEVAYKKAKEKVIGMVMTDEQIEKTRVNLGILLMKVGPKIDKLKGDMKNRDDALACVEAAEQALEYWRTRPDSALAVLNREINELDRGMNENKRKYQGVYITKVPFNSILRDELDRLKKARRAMEEVILEDFAQSFGFDSYSQAVKIKEEEEKLWDEYKEKHNA